MIIKNIFCPEYNGWSIYATLKMQQDMRIYVIISTNLHIHVHKTAIQACGYTFERYAFLLSVTIQDYQWWILLLYVFFPFLLKAFKVHSASCHIFSTWFSNIFEIKMKYDNVLTGK